jgi:hypothetical protein
MLERLLAIHLLMAAPSGAAGAEPVPAAQALPASHQALLLFRVLAYDRNLRARAGEELTLAVLFRQEDAGSLRERDAIVQALREAARSFSVSGLHVRVQEVPWRGPQDLDARLAELRAAALYAGESLAADAPQISLIARARSALSFTPSRAMVESGLALGLVHRGTRAGVVVNLPAAHAEGAELESTFLAVVEVARPR